MAANCSPRAPRAQESRWLCCWRAQAAGNQRVARAARAAGRLRWRRRRASGEGESRAKQSSEHLASRPGAPLDLSTVSNHVVSNAVNFTT